MTGRAFNPSHPLRLLVPLLIAREGGPTFPFPLSSSKSEKLTSHFSLFFLHCSLASPPLPMAQRLASLLLRPVRSSSTLTAAFLSTSSSSSSNSNQPNLPSAPEEVLLLEDGKEADLQVGPFLQPDLAGSPSHPLTIFPSM